MSPSPRCPRCRTQLRRGQALRNTLVGSPDFPGDTGSEAGCTVSASGPAVLVPCWKCRSCGYSRERRVA